MDKFKFFIFSIITLAIIGLGIYWAFISIESGSAHASRERQEALEDQNRALEEEVEDLKNELALYKQVEETEPEKVEETTPTPTNEPTTSYKNQTLINELQELINDNVYMKEKSRGTRVGTIQNFLNLYNGTTKKVDNDYGKTTKTDIIDFQKDTGLTADGQTGPTTYQKMIDWLKKQG